jgi:hypothetical protein
LVIAEVAGGFGAALFGCRPGGVEAGGESLAAVAGPDALAEGGQGG